MNSSQLTREQLDKIYDQLKGMAHYLDCLTGRMHQKHFPTSDPLKMLGEKARAAVTELRDKVKQVRANRLPGDQMLGPPMDW